MNILLVIWGDIHYGGVSVFLNNLLKYMDKSHFKFTLYAFGDIADQAVCDMYNDNGVEIILGHHDAYDRKSIAKDLYGLLKKRKFDVVHSNTGDLRLSTLVMVLAFLSGVGGRIAHSHGVKNYERPYSKRENIYRFICRIISTNRLACSDEAARHLFGRNISKYILVKNGIPVSKYSYNSAIRDRIRHEVGCEGSILLGTVGRLVSGKNQKYIIDVFKEVAYKIDAKLIFVGDGEMRKELETYINDSGLSDKVIFTGNVGNVNEYLQAMDIFVFASLYEGFGIAVLEAQAADLPVWCSDRVSKEIKISDRIKFMSVNIPPKEWSKEIIDYIYTGAYRERYSKENEVIENGYDIISSAKSLYDVYMDLL